MDFDQTWTTIKEIILKNFAGDPVEGVPSPSVQNTIYLSQKDILAAVKEVSIGRDIANFPLAFPIPCITQCTQVYNTNTALRQCCN